MPLSSKTAARCAPRAAPSSSKTWEASAQASRSLALVPSSSARRRTACLAASPDDPSAASRANSTTHASASMDVTSTRVLSSPSSRVQRHPPRTPSVAGSSSA